MQRLCVASHNKLNKYTTPQSKIVGKLFYSIYMSAPVLCHRIYVLCALMDTASLLRFHITRMIRATYLLFQTKHFTQYIHSVDFRWQIQIHTDAFALLKCRHCEYLRKKTWNLNAYFSATNLCANTNFLCNNFGLWQTLDGIHCGEGGFNLLANNSFCGISNCCHFCCFLLTIYCVSETKQVKYTRTYGTLLINNVNFKCLNDARDTFTYLSLNEMLRVNIIVMMDGKFSIEHHSAIVTSSYILMRSVE